MGDAWVFRMIFVSNACLDDCGTENDHAVDVNLWESTYESVKCVSCFACCMSFVSRCWLSSDEILGAWLG
jgi:hypothetical protein